MNVTKLQEKSGLVLKPLTMSSDRRALMSSLTTWPNSVLYFIDALGIKTPKEEQGSEK